MGLKEKITDDLKQAQRARDQARVSTLRLLQAAIQRREVDERIVLDDEQVLTVINKMIKQGREAIAQFEKGGRQDLVSKEQGEIAIWQVYLPAQLSEAEVDAAVADAIADTGASTLKDMGKVMGALKAKLQGQADMGRVGAKVKAKLGG
jgi:uncharacterized protein